MTGPGELDTHTRNSAQSILFLKSPSIPRALYPASRTRPRTDTRIRFNRGDQQKGWALDFAVWRKSTPRSHHPRDEPLTHTLLPPTDRMRQATGIGERNFQRTSNQRNETMMKEASDFASHLRKCDRAIAEMKSACETVLSTTKIAMNAPLPRAFCRPLLSPRARRLSCCPPSPRRLHDITTTSPRHLTHRVDQNVQVCTRRPRRSRAGRAVPRRSRPSAALASRARSLGGCRRRHRRRSSRRCWCRSSAGWTCSTRSTRE